MGIRLVVEVLDHAPADLTPAERLVLVVLAEYANDKTRLCWPKIESISARTGLKPESVSQVFRRLSRRTPSLEVRVELKKGKDGRPVFAYEGTKTKYRIPKLAKRADQVRPSHERADEEHSSDERADDGRASSPETSPRGPTVVRQRADGGRPLTLNEPSQEQEGGSVRLDSADRTPNGLHPLPDDFALSDAMRRWSLKTFGPDLDVDHETKQFVSHFRAEGVRKRSWPDAWQKWMRNAAKFASERQQRPNLRAVSGESYADKGIY
ncbi:hypothetical protein GT352_28005 [Streptomyces sp. SID1046]|uniref:helix-turn-helix domain-containing protein n=1 Tax=Streptomyces sp. SID1046 TaxID=2690249 RepID=UPI001370472A|nr:hypothetical protein [Streptomyces sp. SID1046]